MALKETSQSHASLALAGLHSSKNNVQLPGFLRLLGHPTPQLPTGKDVSFAHLSGHWEELLGRAVASTVNVVAAVSKHVERKFVNRNLRIQLKLGGKLLIDAEKKFQPPPSPSRCLGSWKTWLSPRKTLGT